PQREVADNRIGRDAPQDELDRKVDPELERQILRDLLYGLRQQLKRHEQPTKQDEQRIIKLVERIYAGRPESHTGDDRAAQKTVAEAQDDRRNRQQQRLGCHAAEVGLEQQAQDEPHRNQHHEHQCLERQVIYQCVGQNRVDRLEQLARQRAILDLVG